MRQFMIFAAALTVSAALLAPALAESNGGGPLRKGDQCFKYTRGYEKEGRFGIWQACPQTASVAVAPRQIRRPRAASR